VDKILSRVAVATLRAPECNKLARVRVHVLYFAILREKVGRDRELLELPADADVGAARAAIAARHPELEALLPLVQTAVNRAFAGERAPLADGDELALIPPVAGGAGRPLRKIAIMPEPLELGAVIEVVEGPERGGLVTFSGIVRRQGHHLPDVVRLEYEAYAEMAVEVIGEIAAEIEREQPGTRLAIHHRVGSLAVGETAVVIAAAAPHRAEAFAACRAAIDRLKERAPIWKKEIGESGEAWLGLGP
jgi:molybdopterin synthase catalytic subunit